MTEAIRDVWVTDPCVSEATESAGWTDEIPVVDIPQYRFHSWSESSVQGWIQDLEQAATQTADSDVIHTSGFIIICVLRLVHENDRTTRLPYLKWSEMDRVKHSWKYMIRITIISH